jgi:hypothetical protein
VSEIVNISVHRVVKTLKNARVIEIMSMVVTAVMEDSLSTLLRRASYT